MEETSHLLFSLVLSSFSWSPVSVGDGDLIRNCSLIFFQVSFIQVSQGGNLLSRSFSLFLPVMLSSYFNGTSGDTLSRSLLQGRAVT